MPLRQIKPDVENECHDSQATQTCETKTIYMSNPIIRSDAEIANQPSFSERSQNQEPTHSIWTKAMNHITPSIWNYGIS